MTTLGILDCIPPEFYRGIDVREPQHFIDLLEAAGYAGEFASYHVADDEFPPTIDACDCYLITGSPANAFDDLAWINKLKQFIRDAAEQDIPQVGICFGHQVIAEAMGGKVERSSHGWQVGLYETDVLNHMNFMPSDKPKIKLYQFNQDQVTQLPPDAIRLGTSDICENFSYRIGDHILSIQGHPEMKLDVLKGFVEYLSDTLPDDVKQYADTSTQEDKPHADEVAKWIINFLDNKSSK